MNKKLRKGFTLIELMIVVAIIGILAAIAIPNFIRYQLRSKSAEAKTVMGGIKTAQESFRGEYDFYVPATQPAAFVAGVKTQWGAVPCGGACTRQNQAGCAAYDCIGYQPQGDVYFQYVTTTQMGPPEYLVVATGDIDGDGVNQQQAFGTANTPNQSAVVMAGPGNCAAMPPSEVTLCTPEIY